MPADIKKFRLPRFHEIPDVRLYLDQTVKYINSFLAPLGLSEITSSMVSNYVKKGYISNPVRKQYSAEQIAYLFGIVILKNVVSMENIPRLFSLQRTLYTTQVAYDYFCAEMENVLYYTFGLKDEADEIGTTTSTAKDMLRSVIIAVSHIIFLNNRFYELESEEAP